MTAPVPLEYLEMRRDFAPEAYIVFPFCFALLVGLMYLRLTWKGRR